MRPLKHRPEYTVSDYNLWEGDWELIDGLAYAMSPSPVKRHQRLAALLIRQIGNAIERQKDMCGDCEEVYELDWIIDDRTVLRPDIAIICDRAGDFIRLAPVLVIEIISPSTAYKDRQVKFDIYQEQGVKYYIIADPTSNSYNIYVLSNKLYKEQNDTTSFIIHDTCNIELSVEKALADLGTG